MRVLNFGSLNIDEVYQVPNIVRPGQTITARQMDTFVGGKGLNQSVALAKAGVPVLHAGAIGEDGEFLLHFLQSHGVDTSLVQHTPGKNGHAVIQVDEEGQNSIFLYSGSNRRITHEDADRILSGFGKGDLLLLQNEISSLDYIIATAAKKGMTIALNPSPYDEYISACDLSLVRLLLVNEVEGEAISGTSDRSSMAERITERYPQADVVLTLGREGAVYRTGGTSYRHGIFDVPVVDTTAAGDTFTGYFLAGWLDGFAPPELLKHASMASSIAVSRAGAAVSIPTKEEVMEALAKLS